MITFFEATLSKEQYGNNSVRFDIKTEVDGKMEMFNKIINFDLLATKGFVDIFMEHFTEKIKHHLSMPEETVEAQKQQPTPPACH